MLRFFFIDIVMRMDCSVPVKQHDGIHRDSCLVRCESAYYGLIFVFSYYQSSIPYINIERKQLVFLFQLPKKIIKVCVFLLCNTIQTRQMNLF